MSFSVGGLASGLDTESIISKLLDIEKQPILRLQQREADYQVKLTSYGNVKSALSALKSAIEGIDSPSELTQFSAVSGNSSLLTASADTSAAPASYNITVTNLAQEQKLKSMGFPHTGTEYVGEGTIHLRVGTNTTDISVGPADALDDVAKLINDANTGVKATVVFDGTNDVLTLASERTGLANKISISVTKPGTSAPEDIQNTDASGLSRLYFDAETGVGNLIETQAAEDASLNVDGVPITRSSNTISDAITGITISLKGALTTAPDNTTTLTVSRNTAAVAAKINAFVDAYNKLVDTFKSEQAYNAQTKTGGALLGDSAANRVRNQLGYLIQDSVPGLANNFSRLADFGITLNDQGHLEVNSSKLNGALSDHASEAIAFFTQTTEGSEGFAVRMAKTLTSMLDSTQGPLEIRTKGIRKSIEDLDKRMDKIQTRVDATEERLRAQFKALESLVSQYNATGSYLTQQLTSLQNLNRQISGQ